MNRNWSNQKANPALKGQENDKRLHTTPEDWKYKSIKWMNLDLEGYTVCLSVYIVYYRTAIKIAWKSRGAAIDPRVRHIFS